jgi:uncharacterized RDD family membrane protein YckC
VDWLIRMVAFLGVSIATIPMGGMGTAASLIFLFALEWLYPVVFELGRAGATPGKALFGLKVVMDNGVPVTPAASLNRNLLRAADFLPFGYAMGLLCMLTRHDFRRLGDLAAATLVVYRAPPLRKTALPDVEPLAPARPLSQRDQATIIALAARAPRLTGERLDELAALAAPVSGDAPQPDPRTTRRVLGVAQWLLGRRA